MSWGVGAGHRVYLDHDRRRGHGLGFLVGWIADKIGVRRRWRVLSQCRAGRALVFGFNSLPLFYLAAFLFALAFYPIFGLVPSYIGQIVPVSRLTQAFGIANVLIGLGGVCGNFLGGFSKDLTGSFSTVYWVVALLLFVQCVMVFMLGKPAVTEGSDHELFSGQSRTASACVCVQPFARRSRAAARPLVIWLTGISAAGKSTIADALDRTLQAQGRFTSIIDGDSVRGGLCRDLGFTDSDRDENIRRVAEVARLMVEAGLIVIVALISPSSASRHCARSIIGNEYFVEVHVDAPCGNRRTATPKACIKPRELIRCHRD
jgi:adenylyl-sulfate kinase